MDRARRLKLASTLNMAFLAATVVAALLVMAYLAPFLISRDEYEPTPGFGQYFPNWVAGPLILLYGVHNLYFRREIPEVGRHTIERYPILTRLGAKTDIDQRQVALLGTLHVLLGCLILAGPLLSLLIRRLR